MTLLTQNSLRAFGIFVLGLSSLHGAADAAFTFIWLDERPYCEQDVADASPALVPIKRVSPAATEMAQRGKDSDIYARLVVDAGGDVADVEILKDSGTDVRAAGAASRALMRWAFQPERSGVYCVHVYFDGLPTANPWDNPNDPKAPKPLRTTQINYPAEAIGKDVNGDLTFAIEIDRNGAVQAAGSVDGVWDDYGILKAARDSLMTWVFPAGRPGRYRLRLKVEPPVAETP